MIIRRYLLFFADGKTATCIDPLGEPLETLIPSLTAIFADGYLLRVQRL